MRRGQRIGVIIPALNEERAIGRVIADVPDWVDDIVVVDNGSTDGTAAAAEIAGATVIAEPERGYGAACLRGIRALGSVPDVIVFLDGDYSDKPTEMPLLVDPILEEQAVFVVGSRITGHRVPGALTPHQRFGNWFACFLMSRIWSTTFTDLGPFRAIRRDALEQLQMQDRAYGWTVEMQIKAAASKLASLEVPVTYRPRIGTSKISGTVSGSTRAAVTILSHIVHAAFTTQRA